MQYRTGTWADDSESMPVDVCVRVGRRIRYLRTSKGVSQAVLADLAELSQVNLSRIETGKAEPGLRTLQRIARALGVTITDLLDGE